MNPLSWARATLFDAETRVSWRRLFVAVALGVLATVLLVLGYIGPDNWEAVALLVGGGYLGSDGGEKMVKAWGARKPAGPSLPSSLLPMREPPVLEPDHYTGTT